MVSKVNKNKMNVYLSSYSKLINDVEYTIVLFARISAGQKWKFMVEIKTLMAGEVQAEGPLTSMKIPLKIFKQVQAYLYDGKQSKFQENIEHEYKSNGSLRFSYKNIKFSFSPDLISIIKSKEFEETFTKALRKCNHPFAGVHQENIIVWTDQASAPDNLETVDIFVEKFSTMLNDEFTISVNASTTINLDRWFMKIELSLSTKSPTRPSGRLNLSPIDFLALRDYCIQFKKNGPLSLFTTPSGKSVVIVIDADKKIHLEIDDQKLIMNKEMIDFICAGEYMINLVHLFSEFNHELTPQPIYRWWFNNGTFVMDNIDKLGFKNLIIGDGSLI